MDDWQQDDRQVDVLNWNFKEFGLDEKRLKGIFDGVLASVIALPDLPKFRKRRGRSVNCEEMKNKVGPAKSNDGPQAAR